MNNGLSGRNIAVIIMLGLGGQIAWNVENSWFNTFVFDTITPNPEPIAVMVAVSSIVATLTTLIIGTISDRIGRRKPFIFFGYVLWALSTAVFPMSGWAGTIQRAVFLVVLLDAVMTFFGSSANDAAFNAWVTDITNKKNRGLTEGILMMLPVFAVVLGTGVSGLLIDKLGYFPFFLVLGALVLILGITGSAMLKESPGLTPSNMQNRSVFIIELIKVFRPSVISRNRALYIVFVTIAISSIAQQVVSPFEIIYLNNYIGISKSLTGLLTALVAPVLIIFAIPIGKLSDKGYGLPVLVAGFIISAAGQFFFGSVKSLPLLVLFGILKNFGFLMLIVLGAWARNLMPEESRGQFQGVRLIFLVMLPMIIGPAIGSFLINHFGIPTVLNNSDGFIPTPAIYRASSLIYLLCLAPVMILKKKADF